MPDFFRAVFFTSCEKSETGGQPTVPDFFGLPDFGSKFPDFLPDFVCIPMCSREFRPLYPETTSYSSTMDTDGQAPVGCVGRSGSVSNYSNVILINVVEEYPPQGLEAWRGVAMAKPEEVVANALVQLYNNQLKAEMVVVVMATATATVTTTAGGGGGSSSDDTKTLSTATMTVIAVTTTTMTTTVIVADDYDDDDDDDDDDGSGDGSGDGDGKGGGDSDGNGDGDDSNSDSGGGGDNGDD